MAELSRMDGWLEGGRGIGAVEKWKSGCMNAWTGEDVLMLIVAYE